ncbi:MAG: hypothetical protein JSW66_18720 [Phycisphaerales bacterium]|nr:MAG: hypothetical protein JSW66_18720 [Phycisphaerales bacterium]
MAGKLKCFGTVCALTLLLVALSGTAQANWIDTFNNNTFDLATWEFLAVPNFTTTYNGIIQDGPDDNDYLSLVETTSIGATPPGSIFGGAFGSNEQFTDVRVGAVVNVAGDASRNNYVLLGRAEYIVDDGSTMPYPGLWTNCYVLILYYDDGPANLHFEVQKVIYNDHTDVMSEDIGAIMPGLNHARSYYAELDIVGSDPVYITGSLYEYKGGPLVAKAPTLIDTNGRDPWEKEREINYPVFANGVSGVSAYNGDPEPPGYYCTFDDVFSVSDGPAAVNPSPADGAIDVPVNAALSWVEAAFATGREVWLGKPGAMEKIATPADVTHMAGPLEFGQTYEWRVDQIGPSGTVIGHTWTFTTSECLAVEDFQSYTDDADLRAAWVDNITEAGLEYVFLAEDAEGNKSMRFEFQNQYEPYYTEATRTFVTALDLTQLGVEAVSLFFIGEHENAEHPMYVIVEDTAGQSAKVVHPYTHACESETWQEWTVALADFSAGGVDLTSIKKVTIGLGTSEGPSAQAVVVEERDHIYIDPIRLCPVRCFNVDQVDLRGDLNGDCRVDIDDLVIMMDNWLNSGLSAAP